LAQARFGFLANTIRVLALADDQDLLDLYRGWFGSYPFYHFDGALTVEDAWHFVMSGAPYCMLLHR
jgi:hypothetical protein